MRMWVHGLVVGEITDNGVQRAIPPWHDDRAAANAAFTIVAANVIYVIMGVNICLIGPSIEACYRPCCSKGK